MKKIFSKSWRMALGGAVLFAPLALMADVSPLCSDLATFSCAPGHYKDGTGEVKSESEVQKFISSYAEKSRTQLHDRFVHLLKDPANSYFKNVAMSAFGLKNSPACTSKDPEEVTQCQENLIDGLTTLTQKQALGRLLPRTGLERQGNMRDLAFVMANNTYKKLVDEFNDQVQADLSQPEMTKNIQQKIFPKVKDLLIARLKQMSIPDAQRDLMISKISGITFEGASCGNLNSENRGHGNDEVVSSLLVPNAFYDPGRNIFKFCAGYLLQANSEFIIVQTIAHELSHSIDPCCLAIGPVDLGFSYKNAGDLEKMQNEYPIKNVLQCLRDPRSVGAQHFAPAASNWVSPTTGGGYYGGAGNDGYPMPAPGAGGGMGSPAAGPAAFPAAGAAAAKSASFCENDQIGESFADWMAAEVLPQYMEQNHKLTTDQYRNGYGNTWRLDCEIPATGGNNMMYASDPHPSIEKRINNILLMNPKVREQMGCQETPKDRLYCDSEKAVVPAADRMSASPKLLTIPPQNGRGGSR